MSRFIDTKIDYQLVNSICCQTQEVRIMTEEWRHDYNHQRPHKSSGYLSPVKYAEQRSEAESKAKQDQLNGDRKPPKIEGSRLAEDREKDHLIIENLITN
ncbi:MAG: transposase [Vallitaleaceae bacterium]|nr:transposase [Vallitaleaceae bacterium]